MGRYKEMAQDIDEEYKNLTPEEHAWFAGYCAAQQVDWLLDHPGMPLNLCHEQNVKDLLQFLHESDDMGYVAFALQLRTEYFRSKLTNQFKVTGEGDSHG